MFILSVTPLEEHGFGGRPVPPESGACVFFEGRVRKSSRGREVVFMEYEAAEEMAHREFEKITGELKKKFEILDIRCAHRIGKVHAGEVAVWVGVTAAHRDAAFAACRGALDELKQRLPIWKKEHYADGMSEWVLRDASPAGG